MIRQAGRESAGIHCQHYHHHHVLLVLSLFLLFFYFFKSTSSDKRERKKNSGHVALSLTDVANHAHVNSTKTTCHEVYCGFCTCGVPQYTFRHINATCTHKQPTCHTDLVQLLTSTLAFSQCRETSLNGIYFGCYLLTAFSFLPLVSLHKAADEMSTVFVFLAPLHTFLTLSCLSTLFSVSPCDVLC